MEEKILGVYSRAVYQHLGEGHTMSAYTQKTYWYVTLRGELFCVQPLNEFHIPSGFVREVTREELLAEFVPEPRYFERVVLPAMDQLKEKLAKAARLLEKRKLEGARKNFDEVARRDDANMKAGLGLTRIYYEKEQYDKAREILTRVVEKNNDFGFEQRKDINSLGIELRKLKKFDAAVDYYQKVLDIWPEDDHAHFNISRALFEGGELEKALDYLRRGLKLNPKLEQGLVLLKLLEKKVEQARAEARGGEAPNPA